MNHRYINYHEEKVYKSKYDIYLSQVKNSMEFIYLKSIIDGKDKIKLLKLLLDSKIRKDYL